jgi:hypothetical protein
MRIEGPATSREIRQRIAVLLLTAQQDRPDRGDKPAAPFTLCAKAHFAPQPCTAQTAVKLSEGITTSAEFNQDHRAMKRLTRPMLGFKSFWADRCTIAGIETMHAIRKGQLTSTGNALQTPAEQFYALAA